MENKSSIIDIRDVSLTIRKTQILDRVTHSFSEGGIHGLVGRNGSGKTMLMKCICGFVRVSKGEIRVRDRIVGKDLDFPEDIGIIIETPGFIPYYSGYKNLRILSGIKKKINDDEIKEIMFQVGLNPKLKRPVRKYSLGMRQRLGLAQAIMEDPSILILDEPFNGLDREGVEDMRRYLLDLRDKGKTILVSSHSEEDIRVLCDDVVEMDKGRVISVQ